MTIEESKEKKKKEKGNSLSSDPILEAATIKTQKYRRKSWTSSPVYVFSNRMQATRSTDSANGEKVPEPRSFVRNIHAKHFL